MDFVRSKFSTSILIIWEEIALLCEVTSQSSTTKNELPILFEGAEKAYIARKIFLDGKVADVL